MSRTYRASLSEILHPQLSEERRKRTTSDYMKTKHLIEDLYEFPRVGVRGRKYTNEQIVQMAIHIAEYANFNIIKVSELGIGVTKSVIEYNDQDGFTYEKNYHEFRMHVINTLMKKHNSGEMKNFIPKILVNWRPKEEYKVAPEFRLKHKCKQLIKASKIDTKIEEVLKADKGLNQASIKTKDNRNLKSIDLINLVGNSFVSKMRRVDNDSIEIDGFDSEQIRELNEARTIVQRLGYKFVSYNNGKVKFKNNKGSTFNKPVYRLKETKTYKMLSQMFFN